MISTIRSSPSPRTVSMACSCTLPYPCFLPSSHSPNGVACKIAEAISPRHYQDGFHSTGTCGPFGSAAACAKLLHFEVPKILNAFGLVASQSGGLRENFGTMTKPYQAGHAAESGVT